MGDCGYCCFCTMWFRMHPWVFPIIIGGIGVLYLIYNTGAIIETKKIQAKGSDHHISGIPFLGGIHLLIAGLISPIKWLALLCVLDYTFWSFLYRNGELQVVRFRS